MPGHRCYPARAQFPGLVQQYALRYAKTACTQRTATEAAWRQKGALSRGGLAPPKDRLADMKELPVSEIDEPCPSRSVPSSLTSSDARRAGRAAAAALWAVSRRTIARPARMRIAPASQPLRRSCSHATASAEPARGCRQMEAETLEAGRTCACASAFSLCLSCASGSHRVRECGCPRAVSVRRLSL